MGQTSTDTKKKTKVATNDAALARKYALKHYNDVMYARGQWYRYEEGVWNKEDDIFVRHDIWRLLEAHENKGVRPTSGKVSSVLDGASVKLAVRKEGVDAAENLINLKNGVYDLETQKLYPHKPDYYLTTQLPFEYDPTAEAITWQMYLMSTFVKPRSVEFDKELAEFVQEAIGYSLTTSVAHHVTFWCYGEGANGKGVLFHALRQLGGSACVPLNVGYLKREPYQLADLAGKRIALCSEANATKNLVEDAIVKAIVGGDELYARQVFKSGFTLEPRVKLWWSMNELPAVADTSEGFWRRVRVIPFNRQFKKNERILDLKERLDEELPGIFNWAMDGLRRLRNRGRFVEPTQVVDATEKYKKESNPVELFVEDECYTYDNAKVQSSVIYEAYRDWCQDNGFKAHSSKNFKQEMERLGYYHKKEASYNVFLGVEMAVP